MRRLLFAFLCAATALAAPRPSQAQAVKGMTLDQYLLMQERVDAFCNYYVNEQNGVWPSAGAGLRLRAVPGTTLEYVYSQGEVQALIKHCRTLMNLMSKARQ